VANAKYDEGRVAIAKGDVDLDTAVIDLVAVSSAYAFDASHSSADLTGILDTDAALASQAVDAEGYFTTDPAVLTGVAVGEDPAGFVLRVQGGVLLAFYDTSTGGIAIALEGDGTNITVNPPPAGWFRN
jgi:hypothetical protein